MTERSTRAFGLFIDPEQLLAADRYPFEAEIRPGSRVTTPSARRVVALATALAASPVWRDMTHAILVARTQSPQGLAFLGHFSDAEVARLHWLPAQLQTQLTHFRYVSWQQAEADVEELATRLVARFGADELRAMNFVGIPRGGLIVLGMLAYALNLRSDRLDAEGDPHRPLVVVDDCSLSGLRFRQFLMGPAATARRVVFAHLYSHPDLRRAVEAQEPRVVAAVAARNLHDLAPQLYGEDFSTWRSRWQERTGEHAYMVGRFEHLGFPWSEPDMAFWDADAHGTREGWRLVPPDMCLKNRVDAGTTRLSIQTPEQGQMRLAPGTFYGNLNGKTLVAELESRQVIAFEGVGADLWDGFLGPDEPEAVLDRLQAEYNVPGEQLRADAMEFTQELLRRGFITQAPRFAASFPGAIQGT